MVPQTVLAFVAFLLLVAPGLSFEILRERRRPSLEETAFREASRIALTSLVFTGAAVLLLAIVRALWPEAMPDPGRWLREKQAYVQEEYRLIGRFFLIELVLALTGAFIADRIFINRAKGKIFSGSVWYHVLRRDRPRGQLPWISVQLKDKTQIAGFLQYYTPGERLQDREISLEPNVEGTALAIRAEDGTTTALDGWRSVIVRGDQIVYFKVKYLPMASPAK